MQLEDIKTFQTTSTVNASTDKVVVAKSDSLTPKAILVADLLGAQHSNVVVDKTITAAATTGARTINKNTGSVNFAAGATSLVVTNSRVTADSVILATVATDDATMKGVHVIAAAGSFTIHPNANPTAETRVNFLVVN
jgi:hypothetical protein